MKDDLIKILNFKLGQINTNIDELNDLNSKIDDENSKLNYIQNAIDNFKGEEHGFDIYKFSNIDRETFNKLLIEVSDDVLEKFGKDSCNYDGLIYLINGINNGISLTLTQEQISAINLLIDKLLEKEKEYQENIVELNGDKQKLEVTELDVLTQMQNKYSVIIDNIEDKRYVTEIDEVVNAICYSNLSKEKMFDILCYLLKYNAEVYETEKDKVLEEPVKENVIDLTAPFEETIKEEVNEVDDIVKRLDAKIEGIEKAGASVSFDEPEEIPVEVETEEEDEPQNVSSDEDDKNYENEMDLSFDETMELPTFDYLNKEPLEEVKEAVDLVDADSLPEMKDESLLTEVDEGFNDLTEEDFEDYNPVLPSLEEVNEVDLTVATAEENNLELPEVSFEEEKTGEELPLVENNNIEEVKNEEIVEESADQKIVAKLDEEQLKALFNEYNLKYDEVNNINKDLLLNGNLDNYRNTLAKLRELRALEILDNDIDVLVQFVLYSNVDIINEVVELIGQNLSVDENDKQVTTNIVFKTMPSVFIKNENGNYDNFVKNIKLFKEYGIDLINLFDFSKEVYVADHEYLVNNYKIVRDYDLTVNDRNAKYLLLLPNISKQLDYYVEAVYKDNQKGGKGEIFDGSDLIKLYPSKLNAVTDETIKRLRYSSENGRKIFGSKEKSLTGEITNLKVDVINMPDEYLRLFFNNEFDIISRDEVSKYEKMVMNNDYVALTLDDMLNKLETYRQGMRYVIEGINISRNKVIRNYNILISNGVEKTKALLFAMCHNLVVTKAEYEKIKTFVNGLGGN